MSRGGGVGVQVRATIARGLLSRTFTEWRRLTDDRWWKKQLLFRDREIELLEKKCHGFRNRPIVVLRKRRLSGCLTQWLQQAQRLGRKRLRMSRAVGKFRSRQLGAVWATWLEYANVRHHLLSIGSVGMLLACNMRLRTVSTNHFEAVCLRYVSPSAAAHSTVAPCRSRSTSARSWARCSGA
jgi:hypothetical protein